MVFSACLDYLTENPVIAICAFFIILIFIYGISKLFTGPKPGRNPFSLSHVKPPKPLVLDEDERRKVLKQRFKPQKVPEDLDEIIIGSGIGGLTCGVLLGRAGHKVLILEQHDQAGGCCHSFIDKGYEFDTGIHYLGQLMEGASNRVLVDQVTEGQVTWVPMSREYDTVAIGPTKTAKMYPMVSGSSEEFAKNLEKLFPTETEAIAKMMKMIERCEPAFAGNVIPKVLPKPLVWLLVKTGLFQLIFREYMKLSQMSLTTYLDSITDNEEFKGVMSYFVGVIGVVPSRAGAILWGVLMDHYIPGSFYPLNGSSEIAFQMIPLIERSGGKVLVEAPVTNILVNENGRVHGVTVHRSSGDVNVYAKRVITDAGVIKTLKYMLPKEIAQKSHQYSMIKKVGPSISFISVFLGLKGSAEELKLPSGNIWTYSSYNVGKVLEDFASMTFADAASTDCPMMFLSFPSAKDPAYNKKHPGKSAGMVTTLVPWSWVSDWQDGKLKHRGTDYNALKESFGNQVWEHVVDVIPKLKGKLDYIDVGTPVSSKHYLGQPEGEMYGLEQSTTRFLPEVAMHLRAQSGIPGLYFTGQDILTAGFNGAMSAALLTCSAILHRDLFSDYHKVVAETQKILKTEKKTT